MLFYELAEWVIFVGIVAVVATQMVIPWMLRRPWFPLLRRSRAERTLVDELRELRQERTEDTLQRTAEDLRARMKRQRAKRQGDVADEGDKEHAESD